jgi:hypothetical protein
MIKNKPTVSFYLATPMTGRTGKELWDELLATRPIYEKHGIEVISPIEKEGIAPDKIIIKDRTEEEMIEIWKHKDKGQIRSTNVFVYIASKLTSQGVMKEYCLARGVCWKPTVGIYLHGIKPGFITKAEDDAAVTSHEEAAKLIMFRWGTRWKRCLWRLKMLNRSIPAWLGQQIREFWL